MSMSTPAPGPVAGPVGAPRRERVASIDVMRGAVMVLMLLDHVRDMVHVQAHDFSPTDPDRTTLVLFFTRWTTHFCAPIFVLLAGVGVSMVLLAALVGLPVPVVAAIGLAICGLHNLLDHVGPPPAPAGAATPWPVVLWMIVHRFGQAFTSDGRMAFIVYPIVPWVGLMAAGYGRGQLFGWEGERRRRFLRRAGWAAIVAFVILRALGRWGFYGDPGPVTPQPALARALMSFLNVTKYPPSLDYLLMTCGPALVALAALERVRAPSLLAPLQTLGRVPLFYYLLQWPYAHLAGLLLGALTGQSLTLFFRSPPDAFQMARGS